MRNLSHLMIVLTLLLTLLAANATYAQVAAPTEIFTYDARPLRQLDLARPANATHVWETLHALAALQGIVNRDSPRLMVNYCHEYGIDTDQFWLDWLRDEDGWLREASLVPLDSLEAIVETFRDDIKGLVVYDPAVPATSCAASTAAGCEDLIPVRFSREPESVYRTFSPDGCGVHYGWPTPPRAVAGVTTCPHHDLSNSPQAAAAFIATEAHKVTEGPRFLWGRSILKSPNWYAQVSQILRAQYSDAPVEVVDPYTFFGLAACAE